MKNVSLWEILGFWFLGGLRAGLTGILEPKEI
jgi:hypothetical protein